MRGGEKPDDRGSPESTHDPSHGTGVVVRSSGGSNTQVIGRRKTIDPILIIVAGSSP
jgi:hypothetical protein